MIVAYLRERAVRVASRVESQEVEEEDDLLFPQLFVQRNVRLCVF
jgi:hypothetical protein